MAGVDEAVAEVRVDEASVEEGMVDEV